MWPPATSSYRGSPAKIGSPAASAEVQPAGRSVLDRKFHFAPASAVQNALPGKALNIS
jgi:hypothetical protein